MSHFSLKTMKKVGCVLGGLTVLGLSGCSNSSAVPPGQEINETNWNKRPSAEQIKAMQQKGSPGQPPVAASSSPAKP